MSEFILKTMLVTTVMHLLMSNKEKENKEKEEIEGIEFWQEEVGQFLCTYNTYSYK